MASDSAAARIRPGTLRRIAPYAAGYRRLLALLLLVTVGHAVIAAASPLILRAIIDHGIVPGRLRTILDLCLLLVALALVDAFALYLQAWASGRVGEGLVYDLRTTTFTHVQRQPLAFFTRAQTGSLVSRLNGDVIGAREALTVLLTQSVTTVLSLVLVLATMFWLSWQIALAALAMTPFFLLPARITARRLQRLARRTMELDAELGSLMTERFNVSGALLSKLYGRPRSEAELFEGIAGQARDVVAAEVVCSQWLTVITTVLTGCTAALVYGLGGLLTVHGTLPLGTLVAMVALLVQLYGPINQLSGLQSTVLRALVSFDRVFEVLDLEPQVTERATARSLAAAPSVDVPAPAVQFEGVCFRYPRADQVSLASLETVASRGPEGVQEGWVLDELTLHAPAGRLTALVGPSGAGKTTIIQLVPRLYDPERGAVRIGGQDVRDLTLESLRETVGVVTQDPHLFHDSLRANLEFARPGATEEELVEALRAAMVWETVRALPDGLDTVVGDRGYRLSGGEKQRVALARLLLKAPPIVVLDEATAHLDSESELAVQQALKTALAGRTSLVIAHRLSTVRDADQILVVSAGRIKESGTHRDLLELDGLYGHLYRTQFDQSPDARRPAQPARTAPWRS